MKYSLNLTLLCFFALLFTACNSKKQETTSNVDSTTKTSVLEKEIVQEEEIIEKPAFSIDVFSDFPPEIDGCSCYFSKNEADFKEGSKYSYMDNYEKTAFVKIDGILVKFMQTNSEMITETHYKSTYKSENAAQNYTLETDTERESQNGDETFLYTGTLKVTNQEGKSVSESFIGECGC
ncbi:hypothetical protein ACE193_11485 [Bernardetia sp. OM2101]|uniref:hypothetical protein n=1 Tax=Bernardetia sp. OM2101 TaxID=3344876 RepID=UPI0035CF914A